jgi:hypothetical protein
LKLKPLVRQCYSFKLHLKLYRYIENCIERERRLDSKGVSSQSRHSALLDGTKVRLNWNIESDLNVYWIKFKNFLSLY